MKRLLLLLMIVASASVAAQQPAVAPPAASSATVTYVFDWPQGVPWQKYSMVVHSDGTTHFQGTPHPDDTNTDTDPVQQDFTMSAANRQKIFDLAQKLNYFQGDLDSHVKHVAQTGKKTLQYESPQVRGSAIFNWSQNPDVQALTELFSAIASTIDYGRKLTFQYRFDKLGMDQRLKELEDLQASHGVAELSLIAPILRKIVADPNLMNMDRLSAKHLLQKMTQPDTSAQTSDQH